MTFNDEVGPHGSPIERLVRSAGAALSVAPLAGKVKNKVLTLDGGEEGLVAHPLHAQTFIYFL